MNERGIAFLTCGDGKLYGGVFNISNPYSGFFDPRVIRMMRKTHQKRKKWIRKGGIPQ